MSVREIFTNRLREVLAKLNISQRELSRQMNVHPNTIQKWLNGETWPPPETIDQIASILEVTPSWLMGGPLESDREIKIRKAKELLSQVDDIDHVIELLEKLRNAEIESSSSGVPKKHG